MDGQTSAHSTYALDTARPVEKRRLDRQAALWDPFTFRQFDQIGVGEGWRCLEIGGGAGSVAIGLSRRVGPTGQVVVTDLETRWLEDMAVPNLEVRRHDVVADPIEEAAYDLIHVRLVLTHLPQRDRVLAKLVAALRPGGWLVAEEPDAHTFGISHPPHTTWAKVATAMLGALESAGADNTYGRKLGASLQSAGLLDVIAEGLLPARLAPDLAWSIVLPVLDQLRERILAMGLATDAELDSIVDEFQEDGSSLWIFPPVLVSARGRRGR
jgi:SAM-dependent methyltransferase